MVQTVDWASREHMMHSYELIARHVMPHFQGSADAAKASNQWAYEHNETLMAGRTRALDRAHEDYAARSA
jgi:limonene 1,2-monooxygenase